MVQQNDTLSGGFNTMDEASFRDRVLATWQIDAYTAIYRYWSVLIVCVGTIGNILSLLVLLRPSMRVKSTFVYLAGVAIADLVYLHVVCFRRWLEDIIGYNAVANHDWMCKSVHFLNGASSHYSVWLIVLVTVERFVVIVNPLMGPIWCQKRRCFLAMAVLLSVVLALNAHSLWSYGLVPIQGRNRTTCNEVPEFSFFLKAIWYWVDTALYSFVPFAVILVLNVMIIIKTRGAGRRRRAMSESSSASLEVSNRLTTMLLTLSFTFLLTTSPMSVFVLYNASTANRESVSVGWVADLYLAEAVCIHLMWTNHAINFFLYCLVGKKFREELKLMILCPWTTLPRRASLTLTSSLRKSYQEVKLDIMR